MHTSPLLKRKQLKAQQHVTSTSKAQAPYTTTATHNVFSCQSRHQQRHQQSQHQEQRRQPHQGRRGSVARSRQRCQS